MASKTRSRPKRVLISFGTRPEAIKLAPVIKELEKYPGEFRTLVLVTAQHRGMLDQVLDVFDIKPDHDLDIMRAGQTLTQITKRALVGLERVLLKTRPDIVLVQGDTTSAYVSALAAYYQRVAVGHVEAGLRTEDKYAPYPEEMNRRLVGVLADLHFAPTSWAKDNLLREGVPASRVGVTGNTVIDALLMALKSGKPWRVPVLDRIRPVQRVILVTAHRRESFGAGFRRICRALSLIVRRNPDVEIVYPVHPNPNVTKPVHDRLGGRDRIHLIRPLEYLPFAHVMEKAHMILTDSGGIQEEAPAVGKPVLVLREKTERPEAVAAGTAELVGTDVARIVDSTEKLLRSPQTYARMAKAANPFGDGQAARRIVRILRRFQL
ncbi:MAG: UDP-N-acetylglucosamine 2-epimerase (non-hydrolyzing) [candidate division WOR-3 bacterium]|nr:MAG: UDP-N-acetylglucosamine 2-epimerase (non-hydrolyzing) [candidate division WOR-3 bacterium]